MNDVDQEVKSLFQIQRVVGGDGEHHFGRLAPGVQEPHCGHLQTSCCIEPSDVRQNGL